MESSKETLGNGIRAIPKEILKSRFL